MSRSYKKTAGFVDKPTKGMKRLASKRVRATKNLSNGGNYKKCFDQYDIHDWRYLAYTKKEEREIKKNKDGKFTTWYKWKRK